MLKFTLRLLIVAFVALCLLALTAFAQKKGGVKSKFYDFTDQVLDGYIKSPTALYTDARLKVKFARLLKLKKNMLPLFLNTAKDRALR